MARAFIIASDLVKLPAGPYLFPLPPDLALIHGAVCTELRQFAGVLQTSSPHETTLQSSALSSASAHYEHAGFTVDGCCQQPKRMRTMNGCPELVSTPWHENCYEAFASSEASHHRILAMFRDHKRWYELEVGMSVSASECRLRLPQIAAWSKGSVAAQSFAVYCGLRTK
jgi:hypothetical protein